MIQPQLWFERREKKTKQKRNRVEHQPTECHQLGAAAENERRGRVPPIGHGKILIRDLLEEARRPKSRTLVAKEGIDQESGRRGRDFQGGHDLEDLLFIGRQLFVGFIGTISHFVGVFIGFFYKLFLFL